MALVSHYVMAYLAGTKKRNSSTISPEPIMKHLALIPMLAVLVLCGVAHAHKVNVFAYVDADVIRVECSFSKSQKVVNGKLVITDRETGSLVHEGVTDAQGYYAFRPADVFMQTGHGLTIVLQAGEGHQDTWEVTPQELQALAPQGSSSVSSTGPVSDRTSDSPASATPPPAANIPEKHASPAVAHTLSQEALEALIGRVMDAKLAPIKQSLIRQEASEPRLQDILGGIGWILGLVGLATFLRYRKSGPR